MTEEQARYHSQHVPVDEERLRRSMQQAVFHQNTPPIKEPQSLEDLKSNKTYLNSFWKILHTC